MTSGALEAYVSRLERELRRRGLRGRRIVDEAMNRWRRRRSIWRRHWQSRSTRSPKRHRPMAEWCGISLAINSSASSTTCNVEKTRVERSDDATPCPFGLTLGEAGSFRVERDGYVEIRLLSSIATDHTAAVAVLAHEVCHYVLESSGIRREEVLDNERLTDFCIFVVGFGGVFLDGFRRFGTDSRPGHRIGYLTDSGYANAHAGVRFLRERGRIRFHLPSTSCGRGWWLESTILILPIG